MQVRISFTLDATDPENSTGLELDHYDRVIKHLTEMGGDDFEFEPFQPVDEVVHRPRRPKPTRADDA